MLPFYHFYVPNASAFFAVVVLVAVANVLAVLGGTYLLHKGCKNSIFPRKNPQKTSQNFTRIRGVFLHFGYKFSSTCVYFSKNEMPLQNLAIKSDFLSTRTAKFVDLCSFNNDFLQNCILFIKNIRKLQLIFQKIIDLRTILCYSILRIAMFLASMSQILIFVAQKITEKPSRRGVSS